MVFAPFFIINKTHKNIMKGEIFNGNNFRPVKHRDFG